MSGNIFQAEDWTYIPDPMGRIGQGYYRNRNNPQQTISVSEYESRRKGAQLPHIKNNEQNINKNDVPQVKSTTRLETSGATQSALSPWDNPVMGEQSASGPSSARLQSTTQLGKTSASAKLEENKRLEEEERKRREQEQIQARNQSNQGGDGGANQSSQGFAGVSGTSNSEGMGGAKVICSEMVRRGLMRERERKACTLYAFSRLPSSFMSGYHFWAVPYVRLMRKYDWACALIRPFVNHRTREVRYRLGHVANGSWIGKMICVVHDPLCALIGKWVSPPDYQKLYANDRL